MRQLTLPILLAAALVNGLLYAALTPPWQAPDEIAHFEYSHLLAYYRRPIAVADESLKLERQIISSLYQFRAWDYIGQAAPPETPDSLYTTPFFGRSRTLSRFSLAYLPYALAVSPFLQQDVVVQLYVMRLVSVLIGLLVVAVVFKLAQRVEPELPALALGASLFVLFLPQHAYILATVSDGNLAELLAALSLYQLVGLWQAGVTWRRAGLGALYSLLAVLTKATTLFLIPLGIVTGLVLLRRRYRSMPRAAATSWLRSRPVFLAALGVVLLPLLSLAFLLAVSHQWRETLAAIAANVLRTGGLTANLLDVAARGLLWRALAGMYTSFWATFGWMSVPLPGDWYFPLGIACALSGLGWALRLRTGARKDCLSSPSYTFMALAVILPTALLVGFLGLSPLGVYVYQGRYLFGALGPIALLLVRGWLSLAPPRQAGLVLMLMTVGLVLLNTAALLLVLVPFFYG